MSLESCGPILDYRLESQDQGQIELVLILLHSKIYSKTDLKRPHKNRQNKGL